ncbi:MAG: efflux RND transporter periplasmic adaptor subunit [Deltaproteobacteria bacterium]|jgi:membrane fusion protein (multidrug efflux system)|nr:efflux RND transporter periplasmic adaptor subunit [Deltaproteobacteria bacterium]MBW2540486.1 efflux RND transporter periplasmic adaptor subunit [Deltaproteobacteria bacterium]
MIRSAFRSRFRALCALFALAAAGCNSDALDAMQEAPPSIVEIARVESRLFSERVQAVGQLAAAESVVVRPEVSGIVESIEFQEGQRVSKGDVLIVLRSEEQRAALREAEANRVLAADVFERTEKLSKVKVSAVSELTQARAKVAAAEAVVDLARVDLERTRVLAPFDGALGARSVSPGDWVDVGANLVQIDAVDRLQLQFSLPENAIALAEPGLEVTARVAAYPDERFSGVVYFVSPALDRESRRLALKAWVPNDEGRLRPGMFARVELEVERTEQAVVIPESAVANDATGSYVWKVNPESLAERAAVELGTRRDGQVVIVSGLAAGDTIVTSGTHKVYEGGGVRSPDAVPAVSGIP